MMGPLMDGDMTMATLAQVLRGSVGRVVIDKTGLTGYFRVRLEFDRMAATRAPSVIPEPDAPPSAFAAVQEQLGLTLESSTALRDVLVIDHLERPSEN